MLKINLLFIAIFIAFAAAPAGKQWTLSEGRSKEERNKLWKEDLQQLTGDLAKLHKNLYFNIKEAEFKKHAAELEGKISQLSDAGVVVSLMSLVAKIGDGHTTIQSLQLDPAFRQYPVQFTWLSDGIFIFAAEQPELVGTELVKIGSMDAMKAFEKIATVYPYDNEPTKRARASVFAPVAEVLHFLQLTSKPDEVQLTLKKRTGEVFDTKLAALAPAVKPALKDLYSVLKIPVPFVLTKRGFYWSSELPKTKTLYIAYNTCTSAPDFPFVKFTEKIGEFLASGNFDKVVVDLRFNGGGNSEIIRPLIDLLKNNSNINKKGNLFVLIGRSTYSSAQLNANYFRKETNAILVGSPTGQKPNHYGEIKSLQLQNSGINVTYSTKFHKTVDGDPPSMDPDYLIEATSKDYFAGRDPVLEAIANGTYEKK
ncbi:MAG: S41 family peptidase [Planctomycetota bacterium]